LRQSRHKTDIEKLKKERMELSDKVNSLQNQIYKASRPFPAPMPLPTSLADMELWPVKKGR
jgi:hypothetical protein